MDIFKQYLEIAAQRPGCLILFRVGDFYEAYFSNAHTISGLLRLPLTMRKVKGVDPVPMCGFPHHSLEAHLKQLVAAGQRVAIAEPDGKTSRAIPKK